MIIPIRTLDKGNTKILVECLDVVSNVMPLYEISIEQNVQNIFFYIWLTGMLVSGCYICAIYIFNYFRLADALPMEENSFISDWVLYNKRMRLITVKYSDKVVTPLTYGVFFPRIVLPKYLNYKDESVLNYVLLHEKVHIMRADSVWKLLSFITISIHWFNPLIWLLHYMFVRDMEMACDEKVISIIGERHKADYAETLINMTRKKSKLYETFACFGYRVIQERIVTIMKYRKRGFRNRICALLLVLIVSLGASFTVFAAEDTDSSGTIRSIEEENLLRGTYKTNLFQKSVKRTVKKNYVDAAQIPASIYYSEYIDGAWYVGTLDATGEVVVLSTGLYQATFSGKIYEQ